MNCFLIEGWEWRGHCSLIEGCDRRFMDESFIFDTTKYPRCEMQNNDVRKTSGQFFWRFVSRIHELVSLKIAFYQLLHFEMIFKIYETLRGAFRTKIGFFFFGKLTILFSLIL
ncbi:hypothetical protein T01_12468 [Trichinella spiralis]|uniref:Uncharacterized protein n=1 Tax=Trichinella spiralis TaxID=6334 RepID=A0A0V1B8N3_TRISP|nr:hypothetical protein T01_12468 [Trichinella spiralis]